MQQSWKSECVQWSRGLHRLVSPWTYKRNRGICDAYMRHFGKWRLFFMTHICDTRPRWVNTLRPRQNAQHFPDDIFKCIFLTENVWISIGISLMFVPKGPINNIPALVQIMAWCQPGDKPLSEPMIVSLLMHTCVTRPQWVNCSKLWIWHYIMRLCIGISHCQFCRASVPHAFIYIFDNFSVKMSDFTWIKRHVVCQILTEIASRGCLQKHFLNFYPGPHRSQGYCHRHHLSVHLSALCHQPFHLTVKCTVKCTIKPII